MASRAQGHNAFRILIGCSLCGTLQATACKLVHAPRQAPVHTGRLSSSAMGTSHAHAAPIQTANVMINAPSKGRVQHRQAQLLGQGHQPCPRTPQQMLRCRLSYWLSIFFLLATGLCMHELASAEACDEFFMPRAPSAGAQAQAGALAQHLSPCYRPSLHAAAMVSSGRRQLPCVGTLSIAGTLLHWGRNANGGVSMQAPSIFQQKPAMLRGEHHPCAEKGQNNSPMGYYNSNAGDSLISLQRGRTLCWSLRCQWGCQNAGTRPHRQQPAVLQGHDGPHAQGGQMLIAACHAATTLHGLM